MASPSAVPSAEAPRQRRITPKSGEVLQGACGEAILIRIHHKIEMEVLLSTLDRFTTAAQALDSGSLAAMREALASLASMPDQERGNDLQVSIARTFTIETQLDAVKLALSTIPCVPQIRIGDFGLIEQELLSRTSALLDPQPDAVIVLWRIEDLHPKFATATDRLDPVERAQAQDELVARIDELCDGFLRNSSAPLFLSTFCTPRPTPLHDATSQCGLRGVTLRLNEAILRNANASERIFVLDFAAWAEHFGSHAFDRKMDLYARAPIARAALPSFARFLARTLAPLIRPSAKLLAVDLDNVLWGGILGESGPDELHIGQDYPGNVYFRIQERLLALRARGIMLALVSKNNIDDVIAAFDARPWMPLTLGDFTTLRVNWLPKHENLLSIAKELNLGVDAIVFVDDQPFEREEVAFHLPRVRLLGESADPLAILTAIEETTCSIRCALPTPTAYGLPTMRPKDDAKPRPTAPILDRSCDLWISALRWSRWEKPRSRAQSRCCRRRTSSTSRPAGTLKPKCERSSPQQTLHLPCRCATSRGSGDHRTSNG